jgi:uncharacterized protein
MFRNILPKQYSFYNFFEQHTLVTKETCRELIAITSQGGDIASHVQRIKELEHQADEITHRCIEALHKTFITPIERTDIHYLIKRLDDIVDFIDSAVIRLGLYDITIIRPETREIADVLMRAVCEIELALKGLRNLKDVKLVNEKCINIHTLESEGDDLMRSALSRLFKEGDALLIIKWKEIFERLEKAVDRCEDVANIIEGVVLASS